MEDLLSKPKIGVADFLNKYLNNCDSHGLINSSLYINLPRGKFFYFINFS